MNEIRQGEIALALLKGYVKRHGIEESVLADFIADFRISKRGEKASTEETAKISSDPLRAIDALPGDLLETLKEMFMSESAGIDDAELEVFFNAALLPEIEEIRAEVERAHEHRMLRGGASGSTEFPD